MSARGPEWLVPMELVRACANGAGTATITRLMLANALFKPHATVRLTDNGFVAELSYEEPKYPGRDQFTAVRLNAVVLENGCGR